MTTVQDSCPLDCLRSRSSVVCWLDRALLLYFFLHLMAQVCTAAGPIICSDFVDFSARFEYASTTTKTTTNEKALGTQIRRYLKVTGDWQEHQDFCCCCCCCCSRFVVSRGRKEAQVKSHYMVNQQQQEKTQRDQEYKYWEYCVRSVRTGGMVLAELRSCGFCRRERWSVGGLTRQKK